MFTIDSAQGIRITRGDTATLELRFEGDAPGENDRVIASLKKSARKDRDSALWEKELVLTEFGVSNRIPFSTWQMDLASEDTLDRAFGNYWWDVRILYADGQITTPFAPAGFEIAEVVTDLPEEGDAP